MNTEDALIIAKGKTTQSRLLIESAYSKTKSNSINRCLDIPSAYMIKLLEILSPDTILKIKLCINMHVILGKYICIFIST